MAYQVGIVGGSGYTGAELLRLLAGHSDLDVVVATAESNAGQPVATLFPSLRGAYPELVFSAYDEDDLAGLDLVFVGLPHGESQRVIPGLAATVAHIVDLGADFRLPAASYEQWYGVGHSAPALLDSFAYGLPELLRDEIIESSHVAAPGCYPTASILALAPLVAAGVIESTGVVVNACSGVSGAGRSPKVASLFAEADASVSAYGLLAHRHTAEIEMVLTELQAAKRAPVQVLFTPHLVPMVRGIHATCTARPAASGLSTAALLAHYRDFYAAEPFVLVVDEPPATKAATTSNAAHVTVRFDERTNTVLAIGVIDNLTKGASGQALQCANLLLGLVESQGLSAVGMWP